jgi:hypothetical protein
MLAMTDRCDRMTCNTYEHSITCQGTFIAAMRLDKAMSLTN